MKFNKFLLGVMFVGIPFFSSCIKSYKLAPSETPQGKEHKDHRVVVKNNLRSVRVYDQWQTDAAFDVLWVSDETRRAFVESYCTRRGIDQDEQDKIEDIELSKNRDYTYFYVLADVRDKYHEALTDDNAKWTLSLKNEFDNTVTTSHVSEVRISPEYQSMFGHRMSKFKRVYEVTFNTRVHDDEPITLLISSPQRQAELHWGTETDVRVTKNKKEKLSKDEDFYWL